jgi:hypothetical protein
MHFLVSLAQKLKTPKPGNGQNKNAKKACQL